MPFFTGANRPEAGLGSLPVSLGIKVGEVLFLTSCSAVRDIMVGGGGVVKVIRAE